MDKLQNIDFGYIDIEKIELENYEYKDENNLKKYVKTNNTIIDNSKYIVN